MVLVGGVENDGRVYHFLIVSLNNITVIYEWNSVDAVLGAWIHDRKPSYESSKKTINL